MVYEPTFAKIGTQKDKIDVRLSYRIVELFSINAFSFAEPADFIRNIPGLWLSGVGLAILARATYEMLGEPRLR